MKTIKTFLTVLALQEGYLDQVPSANVSMLPFNNMFQDRFRIAIPIRNDKIKEIVNMLENGETNSGNHYQVDIERLIAYRIITTRHGDKKIQNRLGRVIRRELGQEWSDEFSRQMDAERKDEPNSEYTIIISRHPLDIVRMSDHREWSSCHAPPERNNTGVDYFNCAFEEATDGGPIAYIVRTSDYEMIKDELQKEEIFKDLDRNIAGVTPISRMRVNRYENYEDQIELAIPTGKIYGARIAGFYDTMKKYFYSKQQKEIDNYMESETLDLKNWGRYGGTYVDRNDNAIFKDFFGIKPQGIDADYIGEGEISLAHLWEEELETHNERSSMLKYTSLNAELSEEGNYLNSYHSIYFSFPNIIEENIPQNDWGINTNAHSTKADIKNIEEFLDNITKKKERGISTTEDENDFLRYNKILKEIKEKNKNILIFSDINEKVNDIITDNTYYSCDDLEWEINNDKITLRIDLAIHDIENPDDFETRVKEAESFEEDEYAKIYYEIYYLLAEAGMINPFESETTLNNYEFKNLDIDYDEDNGIYTIKSKIHIIAMPEKFKAVMANELYGILFRYIQEIYDDSNQMLLFDIDRATLNRKSLPEPELKIEDILHSKEVLDPMGENSSNPQWYTKIEKTPSGYASFNIVFKIPFMDFEKYDNYALNNYLKQIDNNIDIIEIKLNQEVRDFLYRYQQREENNRIKEQNRQSEPQNANLSKALCRHRKFSNIYFNNWYKTTQEVLRPI